MIDFSTLNYSILGAYLLLMLLVGLFFAKRQHSTEDYFLAGRNMPWLPVAMSMYASLTSAVTYMGLPGLAFASNVTLIVVAVVSPLLAPLLAFLFYPFYRRLRVTTSYEYIGLRFGPRARTAVAALFLLARIGWLGLVVYAPAMALSVATGMSLPLAILLMGLLATAYTVMGGLSAVLWTDVLQFLILIGGAVWVAFTLTTEVPGGLPGILRQAASHDHIQIDARFDLYAMCAPAVFISFFLQMMQDYGTDQITVQRLLSIRRKSGLLKAVCFNALTDSFIITVLLFIGLGIFVFYQQAPGLLPDGLPADRVFPFFIMQQLPNGISGLLIAAIFAAAMSSMDSGLNSVTTVLVSDMIRPFRRHAAGEQHDVRLSRYITLVIGAVTTGVAFYIARSGNGIIENFATFMSLFNAPVLALFLLGMLTVRGRFTVWCISVLPAVGVTLLLQHGTRVNWVYYFPVSFAVSFGVSWMGSMLLPEPEDRREYTVWRARRAGGGGDA
jgi:SSS family transporter